RVLARERAHDVAEGLAVAVSGAVLGIGRADRFEARRWRDARRAQRELLDARRRRDRRRLDREARREELRDLLLLLGAGPLPFVAPAPELAPRTSVGRHAAVLSFARPAT